MAELCFLTNVSGEQWAAWAQALLSAAAIFAAVRISDRQHRRESDRVAERETAATRSAVRNRRLAVGHLAADLLDLIRGFVRQDQKDRPLRYPERGADDLFARLATVQADMADWFASGHATLVRRELIQFDTRFRGREFPAYGDRFDTHDAAFMMVKIERAQRLLDVAVEAANTEGEFAWQDDDSAPASADR